MTERSPWATLTAWSTVLPPKDEGARFDVRTQVQFYAPDGAVVETTLGERIALARKRAGLSQEELATAVGAGAHTRISEWERNKVVPEGKFLLKLPEVLGVSADWLLMGRAAPGAPTLPREALEALRDWANEVLPPGGERRKGNAGGDDTS